MFDPGPAINIDLACIGCGYNLRGLSPEHLCPECRTPITQSLRGDLLKYSDLNWLGTIKKGIKLFLTTLVLSLFLVIGAGVIATMGGPADFLILVVPILIGGLLLWAVYLTTTQEPRVTYSESGMSLRRVIRVCAVLNFIGSIFEMGFGFDIPSELTEFIVGLISAAGALGATVSYYGMLVYLRRFAFRIPNPKLARTTTNILWGLPISYFIVLLGGIFSTVMGRAGPTSTRPAVQAAMEGTACIGAFGLIIFSLWGVVVVDRFRRVLNQTIIEATNLNAEGH